MICENLHIARRGILIGPRRIVIGPRKIVSGREKIVIARRGMVIAPRILIVVSEILDVSQQFTFEHRDVRVDHAEDVEFAAAGERKVLNGVRVGSGIG